MSFSDTEQFSGKQVSQWQVGKPLPDSSNAVKLAINPYEDDTPFTDYFQKFTELKGLESVDSLVLGSWGEAYEESSELPIKLLVQNSALFPALTSLFIGDLAGEEAEVSWIQQSDISSVYQAFPKLEILKIRGAEGLSLGTLSHPRINTLIIESAARWRGIANPPVFSLIE